eukprot:g2224.t1
MQSMFSALCVLCLLYATNGQPVTLQRLSQTYLPFRFEADGAPVFCLGEAAAEQLAYDSSSRVLYVSGNKLLRVMDLSEPSSPTVIATVPVAGEITDVAYCGDYVAASIPANLESLPGRVLIYAKYSSTDGLQLMHTVKVGALPDSIAFTPDCGKLVVANEGEAGIGRKGHFRNPEGSVTIINTTALHQVRKPRTENFDFTYLNDDPSAATEAGVRWIWRGQGLGPRRRNKQSLSKDLEPEQVVISNDGKRAYINLQENNALAILDLETKQFISLTGYGEKDLSLEQNALDTSRTDGVGNLRSWEDVYALYQPDVISIFSHEGEDFIITANEGDTKEYTRESQNTREWTESSRGKELFNRTEGIAVETVEALNDTSALGGLSFSTVDGVIGKDSNGNTIHDKLVTYGGRSWSIFKGEDMRRVYDSGNDFERIISAYIPWAFNRDAVEDFCLTGEPQTEEEVLDDLLEVETLIDSDKVENMIISAEERLDELDLFPEPEAELPSLALTTTPNDSVDARSTARGPEPEALAVGYLNNRRIVIISVERGGVLFVYDVTDPMKPIWQSAVHPGGRNKTWAELYNNKELIDIDPEGMVFVSAEDSPIDEPLLLVSGAISGTVSVYAIRTTDVNADCEQEAVVEDSLKSTLVISTQTEGC